jgi:GNAT superfamily N-acetyltransferase
VSVVVREATAGDLEAVGGLTYTAYAHDAPVHDDYAPELRDAAGRLRDAVLLVADDGGRVVGTATYVPDGGPFAELSTSPEDAEFRMLAVDPAARGRGVAEVLVRDMLERARASGKQRMVLSSSQHMRAAHRVYERLGFVRAPELDWSPIPGIDLVAYVLPLLWCDRCGRPRSEGGHEACATARELEPPRHCTSCGRRLVVQVRPAGWTARCSEHGETEGT